MGMAQKFKNLISVIRDRNKYTIKYRETLPSRKYIFGDFEYYWTGWKREPSTEYICGQWIARSINDKGLNYGYYYAIPGGIFNLTANGYVFNISASSDKINSTLNKKLRKSLVKSSRIEFEKLIEQYELSRISESLEGMNSLGSAVGEFPSSKKSSKWSCSSTATPGQLGYYPTTSLFPPNKNVSVIGTATANVKAEEYVKVQL